MLFVLACSTSSNAPSRYPEHTCKMHKKCFTGLLKKFQPKFDRELLYTDFLSYMLYPKVYEEAWKMHLEFGDVSKIPTRNFLFGMKLQEETIVEIAPGKSIIVKLLSVGPPDEKGIRTVFFKINGQTRNIDVEDKSLEIIKPFYAMKAK